MPLGPGKYDEWCSAVREETHAAGVLLIVIEGEHGSGFSVTATPDVVLRIPALLRECADQIERDAARLKH